MDIYQQMNEVLMKVGRFCPVCGKELEVVSTKTTIENSGPMDGVYHGKYKVCPDGHVTFEGIESTRWDTSEGLPQLVFDLDPRIFDAED